MKQRKTKKQYGGYYDIDLSWLQATGEVKYTPSDSLTATYYRYKPYNYMLWGKWLKERQKTIINRNADYDTFTYLPVRVVYALMNANITDMATLKQNKPNDIFRLRGIGRDSMYKIALGIKHYQESIK